MSTFEVKKKEFSYRIQPKPGGGFIARPSDPAMETFEGTTEQEVQMKVLGVMTGLLGHNSLARSLGTNVKVVSRSTVTALDNKTGAALNLDPSIFLEDEAATTDASPTLQFERSKILWPAIIVIVAVVVILYGLFR